jgi:hypothetical protein
MLILKTRAVGVYCLRVEPTRHFMRVLFRQPTRYLVRCHAAHHGQRLNRRHGSGDSTVVCTLATAALACAAAVRLVGDCVESARKAIRQVTHRHLAAANRGATRENKPLPREKKPCVGSRRSKRCPPPPFGRPQQGLRALAAANSHPPLPRSVASGSPRRRFRSNSLRRATALRTALRLKRRTRWKRRRR